MYKARTNVETEEFGLIKAEESITDEQFYELSSNETKFFKYIEDEEDYNPVISADETIDENLNIEEWKE